MDPIQSWHAYTYTQYKDNRCPNSTRSSFHNIRLQTSNRRSIHIYPNQILHSPAKINSVLPGKAIRPLYLCSYFHVGGERDKFLAETEAFTLVLFDRSLL